MEVIKKAASLRSVLPDIQNKEWILLECILSVPLKLSEKVE